VIAAPQCAKGRRSFTDVFEAPRLTVLDVAILKPDPKAEDWMARENLRHQPAVTLPGLLKSRVVTQYINQLRTFVGKTVKPAALMPTWWQRGWPSPRIPGVRKPPSDSWTYWTFTFRTKWRPRGEATMAVHASIGGHSLGRRFGAVEIEAAPIINVQVQMKT
jgi:hypothetical protein